MLPAPASAQKSRLLTVERFSTAPMSAIALRCVKLASKSFDVLLMPPSMATLPSSNACVRPKPPFWESGWISGSTPRISVALLNCEGDESERLNPNEFRLPVILLRFPLARLSATIELLIDTSASFSTAIPAAFAPSDRLFAIVLDVIDASSLA